MKGKVKEEFQELVLSLVLSLVQHWTDVRSDYNYHSQLVVTSEPREEQKWVSAQGPDCFSLASNANNTCDNA